MTIWRLHVNTSGGNCADICLKNKVMAMGWSLNDRHLEENSFNETDKQKIREQRSVIKSYDDYAALIKEWKVYDNDERVNANVRRVYYDVKPNDLVWIRDKGIYYIGRVGENSQWVYDSSQEMLERDSTTQRTCIKWYKVGDEFHVPGKVVDSFILGATLQRIHSDAVEIFSKHYYNTKIDNNCYKDLTIKADQEMFYSLISSTDCEDLVYAYLFKKYGYIVIPSTNKQSTALFECVLLNPKDRTHVYIQVKKGDVDIDANDFRHLQGKVFLFTSGGTVKNLDSNDENIERILPEDLFKFAMSDAAKNVVSDSISYWTEYMRKALK